METLVSPGSVTALSTVWPWILNCKVECTGLFFFFFETGFLFNSPWWTGNSFVPQGGLEPGCYPASVSQVVGLKKCKRVKVKE